MKLRIAERHAGALQHRCFVPFYVNLHHAGIRAVQRLVQRCDLDLDDIGRRLIVSEGVIHCIQVACEADDPFRLRKPDIECLNATLHAIEPDVVHEPTVGAWNGLKRIARCANA